MNINEKNLIWIDLETTSLNPEDGCIIEIATLITDSNLNLLAEGPAIPIYQTNEKIEKMNSWNKYTHTANGLINQVKKSLINERKAEIVTLKFLKQWVPIGKSPICGNSICQDRRFLCRYMPELENWFHYRCLDVSTLKELIRRWKPEILKGFTKQITHRAMQDIYESLKELIYYRQNFINL